MRLVLLVLVLAFFLLVGTPAVITRVQNGGRVGPATTVDGDGLIRVRPETLAAQAGVTVEVYSLARALSSEHGNDGDPYLRAVAWAIRNKARERGISLTRLLTDGAGTAGDGWYGEQKAAAGTKYASTRVDPRGRHVKVAAEVMAAPLHADPTFGATHFFSPSAQDKLAAKAETDPAYVKYKGRTAADVDARWRAPGGLYASGAVPVVPPGVDGRRLTLYRRAA